MQYRVFIEDFNRLSFSTSDVTKKSYFGMQESMTSTKSEKPTWLIIYIKCPLQLSFSGFQYTCKSCRTILKPSTLSGGTLLSGGLQQPCVCVCVVGVECLVGAFRGWGPLCSADGGSALGLTCPIHHCPQRWCGTPCPECPLCWPQLWPDCCHLGNHSYIHTHTQTHNLFINIIKTWFWSALKTLVHMTKA